jgi:hypothetical protein
MQQSKSLLRSAIIVLGFFAAHICMDIYHSGVKDGKATAHALVKNRK